MVILVTSLVLYFVSFPQLATVIHPHRVSNPIPSTQCPIPFSHIRWSISESSKYKCLIFLGSLFQSVRVKFWCKERVWIKFLNKIVDGTERRWDACLRVQVIFGREREYSPLSFHHSERSLNHVPESGVTKVEQLLLVPRPSTLGK